MYNSGIKKLKELKMKKIRNSIILAALLTTSSVMAYGNNSGACSGNGACKMQKQNTHGKQLKKKHKGNTAHFIMRTVRNMNLSKDQMTQFNAIQKKFKKSRFTGITENGFDKKLYIAAKTQTREERVKEEANLIENVYSILNKKQIMYIGMKVNAIEKHREQRKNKNFGQ